VWPMSVLKVALRVLRVPQLVLTKPDLRRERLRRAVISSAAPPGKYTTAATAVQPPAHAGERTLSGTVPGGISCNVGSRPGDARRVMSLVASGTDAHTFTHSHAALDGHRMAHSTGCRDVGLLPALVYCNATTSRYAHTHAYTALGGHCMARCRMCGGCRRWPQYCHDSTTTQCTGGLQLLCAAPPSRMADRFCSSKVRCARPPVCPCKLARYSHSVYYGAASTP
jgi:hypothetical protein